MEIFPQQDSATDKRFYQGLSHPARIVLLATIALVSAGVFSMLGFLLVAAGYGMDFISGIMEYDFNDETTIPALKVIQIFQQIGMFILPPLVFAMIVCNNTGRYLMLNKKFSLLSLLLIFLLVFTTQPLINLLVQLNEQLSLPGFLSGVEEWMRNTEKTAAKLTEFFLRMDSPASLFVNLLMIALLPAIGEELLFRGCVQRLFTDWTKNPHWGIFISAALFSALHLQFYGFIPRMMLGALFGYLFLWSGSLWIPILAHLFNNGAAVAVEYLKQRDIIQFDVDSIGTSKAEMIYVIAAILMITGLLRLFYLKNRNEK